MSTLKATTLSNLAGDKTIGTDRVVQGTAAAWVNFNGTGTVAIRASYNVSSITDNGTGDYTVNFTTALADANYAPLVETSGNAAPGVTPSGNRTINASVISTTQVRAVHRDSANNVEDSAQLFVAVFR